VGAVSGELVDAEVPVAAAGGVAGVELLAPVGACAIGAGGIPSASEAPAAPAQTGFDDARTPVNPEIIIEARIFTKDLHPMTVDI